MATSTIMRFWPMGMSGATFGNELSAKVVYDDPPYGYLKAVRYAQVTVYRLYTSEHTDLEAAADFWPLLPAGVVYQGHEPSRAFGDNAINCKLTRFIHYRREVPFGLITAEIVFTAKGVRVLR